MNNAHNRFTWLPTWFPWWQIYFCAQLLALAKPKNSFTINRKERTRTDPANWWVLSVSLLFLSFSENRLWGLVEISIDWYSRNCINLGCFSVKHPNELRTRSIYMIGNLISVIGKFLFCLCSSFGLGEANNYHHNQPERKNTNRPSQLMRFSVSLLFLSFSENRLWGLVELSIDWYSRNCINLGCFSVKQPNDYAHDRFTWLPTWFPWWQIPFCAQLLALAKPITSITINRKERTRTEPANWSVSLFRYYVCLFLRIACGV